MLDLQGLVLDCSSIAWEPMDQFPPAQEAATSSTKFPIWLALDEIEDPVTVLSQAPRAIKYMRSLSVLVIGFKVHVEVASLGGSVPCKVC